MNGTATLELEHHSDKTGAKIGLWLFLLTEVLLFGGMFLLYAVYRAIHPEDFHYAAKELNPLLGAINTIILLTSSLTVALAIAGMERGKKNLAILMLVITILCAAAFMVNKYFEWGAKFEHGIYPGSPEMEERKYGQQLFFGLYFVMTGLHGLHVVVGIGLLGGILWYIVNNPYQRFTFHPHQMSQIKDARICIIGKNGEEIWDGEPIDGTVKVLNVTMSYLDSNTSKINKRDLLKLENGGLYWHLVDIIWIFLFPLFYLIT